MDAGVGRRKLGDVFAASQPLARRRSADSPRALPSRTLGSVFLVAILEWVGPVDDVASLATALGTTAYELKLTLGAGFPAIVRATVDGADAATALEAIEARGHLAELCDRRNVVASDAMTPVRDFRLESDALVVDSSGERLPYEDVLALVRASHRTTTTTTQDVKERKLRPGMAIATGGLVLSKTTTREVTSRTETREQVLYLFRRSGALPWIFRERSARYTGLGADLRPTSLENFATTVALLRKSAPRAFYDERLMTGRPIRGVAEGIAAADILAHLVAAQAARRGARG